MSSEKTRQVAIGSTGFMLSLASTWFGTHVGGGFASGTQSMSFFISFGKSSWWIPVLVMVLNAVCYREWMVMAYRHKAHNYRSASEVFTDHMERFLRIYLNFAITLYCLQRPDHLLRERQR